MESVGGNLKQILSSFRLKLLLYNLMNGFIVFLFSIYCYFLIYRFFYLLYPVVITKSIFFFCLYLLCLFEFCYFFLRPVIFFIRSFSLKNDCILQDVLRFLPIEKDRFISVYYFAFHTDQIKGDPSLKDAALTQKYQELLDQHSPMVFPVKLLLTRFLLFLLFFSSFLFLIPKLSAVYNDLKNYTVIASTSGQVFFSIQNQDLSVEYGKSYRLKMKAEAEDTKIDRVFICFGGGEFLMNTADSLFYYDFESVNNDITFYFKALDRKSDEFRLKMLSAPSVVSYKITSIPPEYTGLKPEVMVNSVDFRLLYGTTLKIELNVADMDSLYSTEGDISKPISLKDAHSAVIFKRVKQSSELSLSGSNQHFNRKNLLNFNITCVPDLYPGIQVTELQDSLRRSVYYFYGVISDDYGFSDLRFNYSLDNQTHTVVPVRIDKNLNKQEFYFSFDFAEFAGTNQTRLTYFFEIFDNDNLSGPKSTRSDVKNYLIPDLDHILDYNTEVSQSINTALKEAERMAGEIVADVKELQRKLLEQAVDEWEKQQLSEDIVKKKKELDKLLDRVKEENFKKSDLNRNFTKQDSLLIHKQKQIQELLDRILDEDVKKLMQEFSELSKEFTKDKFKNLDEKMKLTFDQISEELDRNLELLKRFQIEEQHDLLLQQLDKLKELQENFDDLIKEKTLSRDSLSALSEEIKNTLEKFKNNYNRLLKDNEALSEPYQLDKHENELKDLSDHIEKQSEISDKQRADQHLSKQIKEQIDHLSNELKQQQQKNFVNKFLSQNDIELIIQNILIISLSQEELLKEFPQVQSQSPRYNELGRLQDLKRQEYKIVKDSLSVLAESNLMLASLLSHKFYDLEVKFGLLPGYIQDNKRSELLITQQTIINYLNDMALSLTEALQKDQQQNAGKEGGEKGGKQPGKGQKKSTSSKDGTGYGRMKEFQNGLKKQLEELVSQMKKGEKGQSVQQRIANTIRENELFKKSLSDYISENGTLSNIEKQLLNEINQMLEENIRDLANYSVTDRLINRNNQIYQKLMISEKASKEKEDYEEKRKSETAKGTLYEKPDLNLEFKRKSGWMKTDFLKSDLKLNSYFKSIYNNYYIQLGNE